jgi:hypothetical protein
VAHALYQYHHDYYFLIDRDHHNDEEIEQYWEKFPDESTDNPLIWRRREIENYFLIPEYLILCSEHLCFLQEKSGSSSHLGNNVRLLLLIEVW